jgi:hypothetical protein
MPTLGNSLLLDTSVVVKHFRDPTAKVSERIALAPDIDTQQKLFGFYASTNLCSRLTNLWIGDLQSIALQPLFSEILATTFLAQEFGVCAP